MQLQGQYKIEQHCPKHPDHLTEKLNQLGKDGWEVWKIEKEDVSCQEGGYSYNTVYLKRKIYGLDK